jgi:hypothetical protein
VTWRGAQPPMILPDNGGNGTTRVTGLPVARLPVHVMTKLQPPGHLYGVPGTPAHAAAGNPAVSTDPAVPPPYTPYGQPRPLGVGQESAWRGGWQFANDKLTTSDRHLISKTGTERSGRNSGNTDPPMDGPSRPSYQTINRTINHQVGSDSTRNQDDLSRAYTRNQEGMFMGEQGSGWVNVNGGVPGLWQPYGSYAGYGNGPVQGIQSPVAQGEAGDGRQSVFSGPPHGLHTETLPDYSLTLGYYMAVPQMRQPRIDRPDNSKTAGQSYSQTVVPQGQTGTIAQQSGSGVAWQQRRVSRWRGQ